MGVGAPKGGVIFQYFFQLILFTLIIRQIAENVVERDEYMVKNRKQIVKLFRAMLKQFNDQKSLNKRVKLKSI